MEISKAFLLIISLVFIACNGGINTVTVGYDGKTQWNPELQPAPTTTPSTTAPTTTPPPSTTAPTTTVPTISPSPSVPQGRRDTNLDAQTPTIPTPTPTTGSIMDNLPPLQKNIFLNEREGAGMPRVNGAKIEGDVYGTDILIVRYTKVITKIKYTDDIKNFTKVGTLEGQNAKVEYPTQFVKIYSTDDGGDPEIKIFGVIEK